MPASIRLIVVATCVVGALLLATLYSGRPAMSKDAAHDTTTRPARPPHSETAGLQKATFAAGCFWCTEAIFQQLKGVHSVVSGYTGGHVKDPTYQQVCSGTTGHAEAVQITYDPAVISYAELLQVFWRTHDPTTLNRQGNDVGTQYRSAIFYHNQEQRKIAEQLKKDLNAAGALDKPIVTEIVPYRDFYPAEKYHQNYYKMNPKKPYCTFVIGPKLKKFEKVFKDRLKTASPGKT
jgi:peptide-methionine (S)-S-oxide reductase